MAAWSGCSARLAPNGAVLKRAAADERLFEKTARAVVFDGLADLSARASTIPIST